MNKKLASFIIALVSAVCALVAVQVPAFATGAADCRAPARPNFLTSGTDRIEYYGTATCVTATGLDTWRAKVGLAQEDINWGPIPNDWVYVDGSYTDYGPWRVVGSTNYREDEMYCFALKQDWKFKARMKYEFDWADGHVTYDYGHSTDSRKACY